MWYRVRHWLKIGLYVIIIYAGLFVSIFTWQMVAGAVRDPDADLVDDSELGKGNRRTDTGAIVESVRTLVNTYRTPRYERDAHSKSHGCVRAEFEVFRTDSIYNHGIFAEPGKYESWVRFSNGTVPALPDPKPDARGMAIKVMGVPGRQLLPPDLAGNTQDFVMINSPAFFVRSIEEYRELEKASADGRPFTYFLGPRYINPFKWRLRQLYLGLGTRKKPPPTPLSTQYYSMSAYQLGPHQMKYSARSCEVYEAEGINDQDPNFLREAMKHVLRSRDACFELMVQLRKPDKRMPIQDTTVAWSEKDAPFVPVARLHIPRQEFDTPDQNAMCESMSFNPWHGVEDLRPLGYINELRRELYLHTAAYRQVRNDMRTKEPKDWCDSLDRYCEPGDRSAEPAEEAADDSATTGPETPTPTTAETSAPQER